MIRRSKSVVRRQYAGMSAVRAKATTVLDMINAAIGTEPAHPDQGLLACAMIAAELAVRRSALFAGPVAAEDEDRVSDLAAALHAQAQQPLAQLANLEASSLDGLRAKAAVWLSWSYGVTLFAAPASPAEDRLLASLLIGLFEHIPDSKPANKPKHFH